jgi:hypothetical protein
VSTALQDRPTAAARPRVRRSRTALVGAAAVLGGLVVVGADRALDALPGFGAPFEEQVVDRSRPALLQSLADLDDYHAAKGRFQVVVDLERDVRNVPAWVKGERTTYLAVGSVDALVDMGALSGDAVQTDGTSATITLPARTLDDARSTWRRGPRARRDPRARRPGSPAPSPTTRPRSGRSRWWPRPRLTAAAVESDLLARAEASTRAMLTGLAGSFGYDDVTVRFEGAADPA